MADCGVIRLRTSGVRTLAYEYLAVSPNQVVGFDGTPHWVLCIENLTTIGMAARQMGTSSSGLVLYTGGMPSLSWWRALPVRFPPVGQAPGRQVNVVLKRTVSLRFAGIIHQEYFLVYALTDAR